MPEKPLNAIPRAQRDLYDKAMIAIQRNNLDYALSILPAVLKVEPGFFEARQALRAAQFKKSGGQTSFFKKMIGGATSQPALAKAQLSLRRNPPPMARTKMMSSSRCSSLKAFRMSSEASIVEW